MLTHYNINRPKVGIKLLKISYVRILILVSLLFVAVINPYSVFLNFQFLIKYSYYNKAIVISQYEWVISVITRVQYKAEDEGNN